jgi:hypothetical protein
MNGKKMPWTRRFAFQLLPKAHDEIVHGARAGIVLVTPHFVKQFIACNDSALILSHILQGLELQTRKTHWLTLATRFHRNKIDPHVAKCKATLASLRLDLGHGFSEDFQKLRRSRPFF